MPYQGPLEILRNTVDSNSTRIDIHHEHGKTEWIHLGCLYPPFLNMGVKQASQKFQEHNLVWIWGAQARKTFRVCDHANPLPRRTLHQYQEEPLLRTQGVLFSPFSFSCFGSICSFQCSGGPPYCFENSEFSSLCETIFRLILNYTLCLGRSSCLVSSEFVVVPVVTHCLLICLVYLITSKWGKSF